MARTNNLTNFLTDVANAIKNKKGDTTDIPASEFDTEIINLPSQGIYQSKQVNISTNGSYIIQPDNGYDAMEEVYLNIEISEDLMEVLNAQDQKIAELEEALAYKTAGSDEIEYKKVFVLAVSIYDSGVEDDSVTADFTINDEQICLQRALKILRGAV